MGLIRRELYFTLYCTVLYSYRDSCGIDLGNGTVIITGGELDKVGGGMETQNRVFAFHSSGKWNELPQLGDDRSDHACSKYHDSKGDLVTSEYQAIFIQYCTVLYCIFLYCICISSSFDQLHFKGPIGYWRNIEPRHRVRYH